MGQHMTRALHVSAAVLLAHAGVIWLLIPPLASPSLLGANDRVILANVVAEMPVSMALRPQPKPAAPATPTAPQPQRSAIQPSATRNLSAAMPGEAAPSTNVAPASVTPASLANSPASTGSSRPAPATTSAVVLPSSDADYLHNPPPAYPRMSRRMGEQGTVLVRVFISAEGRAEKADIRTSSGYARLDEAALETVQRWRYIPGQRAGQPEAMWFNIPIRFVLD